jgi:hypothetical protein
MHTSKNITRIVVYILILLLVISLGFTQSSKAGTSSNNHVADSSPSAVLTGGQYLLSSHPQTAGQTIRDSLQGGSYMLSQPAASPDQTGCCCRGYLSCVRKK